MGTLISQNHQPTEPSQPAKKRPSRKQASLLDVLAAPVVTWTILADALDIDPRNSKWLKDHGVPHRKAGKLIFISGEALRQWIEAESTSSPDAAESSR